MTSGVMMLAKVAAHIEHAAGNTEHLFRRGVAQHAPAEIPETFGKNAGLMAAITTTSEEV